MVLPLREARTDRPPPPPPRAMLLAMREPMLLLGPLAPTFNLPAPPPMGPSICFMSWRLLRPPLAVDIPEVERPLTLRWG